MKVAVVFDTLHPEWEDADYKKEVEAKVEEAEYDVARALIGKGHDVLLVGVADQLGWMLERLAGFEPKVVFNGCESFRGHARHEYAIATVLEMHGYRYTGSSPTGLLVARNKSLTKKILAHNIVLSLPDSLPLWAFLSWRVAISMSPMLKAKSVSPSSARL